MRISSTGAIEGGRVLYTIGRIEAASAWHPENGAPRQDNCYATQNRQSAVRELTRLVDVLLVVGAKNSSNSNRLREIGAEANIPAYLIADKSELDFLALRDAETIGLTAGASAPEILVEEVLEALSTLGPIELETLPGVAETIEFKLPAELSD